MQKIFLLAVLVFATFRITNAQCTTTDGTSCQCKDGGTDCDLLPDIIMANEPLQVAGLNGVIEYAQTGNGVENGRLRVSVSTPNIGHGPLTVRTSSIYICGTDTFTSNPGTCPDASAPRILCYQRVLHKSGATMTYYDRPAGSMTYHPTHNHMHVDDWGIYTLRSRDTAIADPLLWPIIGTGAKLGFCLMDYGTCSFYNGHCVDSAGNTLLNADFPNYGLGGGNYNCDPNEQGISSGYVDIYYQYLDGMYLTIPPGLCNGDYYIVVQIDPHNYFLEENEDNNVIVIPYTITKQVASGPGTVAVSASLPSTNLCQGTALTLSASQSTQYLWNTGDTTQNITVTQPGSYTVTTTSNCGVGTSNPVTVTTIPSEVTGVTGATGCQGVASLTAATTGTAHWFDTPTGSNELHNGSPYIPASAAIDTYYVESHDTVFGIAGNVGEAENNVIGGYYSNDQHQIFTVYKPLILRSVKVYANSTKDRTIELRNSQGTVLQSTTVNVTTGIHTIPLNFYITPGTDYQLGWPLGSAPDLYRSSFGASYPYTFNNMIAITGNSSGDNNRWYCYYNWLVSEVPVACASTRVPVPASIIPAPQVTLSGLDTAYYFFDTPVNLSGTPANGTFTGTGVTGNTFNPAVAGVGGPYNISYQYTDVNTGCTGTATVLVTVLDTATGIQDLTDNMQVSIYPNPGNGEFKLKIAGVANQQVSLSVCNALGEKIWQSKALWPANQFEKNISLQNAPKGIYYLQVAINNKRSDYKLVIQ